MTKEEFKSTKTQKISETFSDIAKDMNLTVNELFIFYHKKYEEFKNLKNTELENKILIIEQQQQHDRKLIDILTSSLNSTQKTLEIISSQNKQLNDRYIAIASQLESQNEINKSLLEEIVFTNDILESASKKLK